MEIIDCAQGSDEWYRARLGMITASEFHSVLNKKTGRGTYMMKLAAERLTLMSQDTYSNANMEWGKEHEEEARECYELIMSAEIRQVGFVKHSDWVGASPDGLIGEDGLIEIKCPNSTTHITNIIKNKMPTTYIPQVQGLLWVTERKWCDFVSYDPRVMCNPLFNVRINRDEDYISNLQAETKKFIKELKEIIAKVDKASF